ncbi:MULTISPECIES: head maturation protease, ClpP-related [Clostridium]|jgi:ATP-dependent protease ClpP protease subunit|uniref:head maturation protease, ClpP-related n=1 Tax=Clostridium TaxID=1485 RepID=UPI0006C54443|nr:MULTISPECIES: head maturation protease, ClpP-related [Clostridium]MDU7455137.1 Clp protease ClpP [Clostridium saudiense]CUN58930.1 Clp protease [Clostridium disporicum]SCJ17136.1 ATP-dependent Clp protease proteolytic subunit [uncultured Clostridium sp.]DAY79202.1 MAG TPA: Putative ATP dependent Clp protease [Caudoviricetes sp.]
MSKFYNFTNNELYIYGDIIGGSEKYSDDDITFIDFKDKLESMPDNSTLNIYVNSGGGSVTATQGIIGILNKAKREKGIKTKCYIDGLAGSCASWLPMVCDEVYCYNTSLMMVHKPMIGFFMEMLNSNDLQKNINILDTIEEAMLNAYESKLNNSTREDIKAMIDEETWLTASEMCDIFNITLLEDKKELVAKVSEKVLRNYKNIPDTLRNSLDKTEDDKEIENKIKLLEIELALI